MVGHYVSATIHVFNYKSVSQLLYGIPIWISAFNPHVEQIQVMFLHCILEVPKCVSYVATCLETGQSSLETRAWLLTLKFGYASIRAESSSYALYMLSDSSLTNFSHLILRKIQYTGIPLTSLFMSEESQAFSSLKQRLLDTEKQTLCSLEFSITPAGV